LIPKYSKKKEIQNQKKMSGSETEIEGATVTFTDENAKSVAVTVTVSPSSDSDSTSTDTTTGCASLVRSIGIVGAGFVGVATRQFAGGAFQAKAGGGGHVFRSMVYDVRPEACDPPGVTLEKVAAESDVLFVCVPSPLDHNGRFSTAILEKVLTEPAVARHPCVVLRSTVPVGFCERWLPPGGAYMPEFLTERNWRSDFFETRHWMLGVAPSQGGNSANQDTITISTTNSTTTTTTKEKIFSLLSQSFAAGAIEHDTLVTISFREAELVKLLKNGYLACKVGLMNEFAAAAQSKLGVDNWNESSVPVLLGMDPRIGGSHLLVPGHDGKRGFGGTCFPKDLHELYHGLGEPPVLGAILRRNELTDRPQREWIQDVGRTTVRLRPHEKVSLVTGGAGFLGSHLCERLLQLNTSSSEHHNEQQKQEEDKEQHVVVCLDNFSSSGAAGRETVRLLKQRYPTRFFVMEQDVTAMPFLPRVDYIWHLACPASPPRYQKDGYGTLQTSLLGMMNMLELCRMHPGARLLFTSTSEVYGDPHEHPQRESYWGHVNPVGPRSCYDEGKRCAETLLYEFERRHSLLFNRRNDRLKIVRLFNSYGPRMDLEDGRVVTNFVRAILEKKPVPVYGDGTQTRSFCYVDDTIEALVRRMFLRRRGANEADDVDDVPLVMNVGNADEEHSMNELANEFAALLGRRLPVQYLPLPADDPKQRRPDITLARRWLGCWEPKTPLREGLRKTLEAQTLLRRGGVEPLDSHRVV
jgi:UDP-glucuronate decarboxylase